MPGFPWPKTPPPPAGKRRPWKALRISPTVRRPRRCAPKRPSRRPPWLQSLTTSSAPSSSSILSCRFRRAATGSPPPSSDQSASIMDSAPTRKSLRCPRRCRPEPRTKRARKSSSSPQIRSASWAMPRPRGLSTSASSSSFQTPHPRQPGRFHRLLTLYQLDDPKLVQEADDFLQRATDPMERAQVSLLKAESGSTSHV